MKPDSIDILELLPYQANFAANNSRFKIGLWARQTGKDHTATAEAVLDCFHNPGTTWIIVAASERQALESLNKAKEWAAILKFGIADYLQAPANIPYSVARTASTEIKWSNGSRLIALPANPSTIRGYSANLILTEFAFHENPESLWRAIYPTISNPLRGGTKKLRIISTPNGLTNKFAHLWHSTPDLNPNLNLSPSNPSSPSALKSEIRNHPSEILLPNPAHPVNPVQNSLSLSKLETGNSKLPAVVPPTKNSKLKTQNSRDLKNLFFKSRVTIHDAIRGGLPLNAAELQSALNDPEAWAQEYLCEFMDNSTVLLPYDLIETCESEFATERSSLDSLSASALPGNHRPQLYAGIDFARKNHLTVCWILEKLPSSAPNPNPNPNPNLNLSPSSKSQISNFQSSSSHPEILFILSKIPLLHSRNSKLDHNSRSERPLLGNSVVAELGTQTRNSPSSSPAKSSPSATPPPPTRSTSSSPASNSASTPPLTTLDPASASAIS